MEKILYKLFSLFYILILVNIDSLRLLKVVGANTASFNNPLNSKLPFSNKKYLKGKGLEMMPLSNDEITNNAIGEPSCEELRAMWRYEKRQHRAAELTNQIPNLPNIFWDLPPKQHQPSSFGMSRSRSGVSFRPKGSRKYQDKIFGRVLLSPGKTSDRMKPLEEIISIMNKEKPSKPKSEHTEPVVHFTPPPEPTPETSFQKLKNLYREERMKDTSNGHKSANHPAPPAALAAGGADSNSKEFGRLVLTPPKGQDGRIANKPRELMSPFERLRFGQVDDLLGIKDEIEGKHVLGSHFPVKRRYGFINFPTLSKNMRLASKIGQSETWQNNNPNINSDNLSQDLTQSGSDNGENNSNIAAGSTNNANLSQTHTRKNEDDIDIIEHDEDSPSSTERIMMLNSNTIHSFDEGMLDSVPQNIPPRILQQTSPALMIGENPSCLGIQHQFCSVNSDCTCVGYGLYRCFRGQCQVLSIPSEVVDDYDVNGGGINSNNMNNIIGSIGGNDNEDDDAFGGGGGFWHSDSVPNTHLGIWDSSPYIDSILNSVDELKRKRKRSAFDKASTA